MAATAMNSLWRDPAKKESGKPTKWTYELGVLLKGLEGVRYATGDGRYFKHIQEQLDHWVQPDGTIHTYRVEEYNIDHVLLERNLLTLYKVTGQEKYRKAAASLRASSGRTRAPAAASGTRRFTRTDDFSAGRITAPAGHPVFRTARNLYLKEISTIAVSPQARPALADSGDVIMAVAKVGRGTVFAVGDPWLYNEYVDGRKLPAEFDNYEAASDLALWLLRQAK